MAGTRTAAANTIRKADHNKQALINDKMRFNFAVVILFFTAAAAAINGQNIERELNISSGQTLEIVNRYGRVDIVAQEIRSGNAAVTETARKGGNETVMERAETDP